MQIGWVSHLPQESNMDAEQPARTACKGRAGQVVCQELNSTCVKLFPFARSRSPLWVLAPLQRLPYCIILGHIEQGLTSSQRGQGLLGKSFGDSNVRSSLHHHNTLPPANCLAHIIILFVVVSSPGLTPKTTVIIMSGILLAPYNDSMRLGQGYNSFLHAPCIYDAMQVNPDRVSVKPASSNGSTSQAVNYSSRFVDKISDVVKSLNVSAGGSIKNGGIIGSSNTATLDEAKFAASDLNAIVSVKVVNQTSELLDTAVFKPLEGIKFTNESFMTVYGNCYISGMYWPSRC